MRVRHWSRESLASGGESQHRRLAEHWNLSAERETADLERRIAELCLQIHDAEKRYVKASQELKMLSTLQERRAARERDHAQRREQRDLDEFASHSAARP
jgi:flagellar export protein FliJ